ncbi:hypothetical protein PROFUN_13177 [Planoprotostelium fungivorum]|uniref:Protein kinase domain-containing protein n=1 Tax=Planoprotostelium fungivorum TaxID=1890364 RepID=A0A2P6N549_9EUKA|nr:hypothetical protein PROFUN_13177 [Planoprotostelium fungivorum]
MSNTIVGPDCSYTNLQYLSEGDYGQVVSGVQEPGGRLIAIKKINKKQNAVRIATEILAGQRLKNVEGVVPFRTHFETSNHHWLVFDFAPGHDLYHSMAESEFRPMHERVVRVILSQLATALGKIHEKGVAHKDIKLENVIWDNVERKASFIDFGLCVLDKEFSTDYAGSKEYAAPELLAGTGPYCPKRADVWALGVTIFALLFGVFPFSYKEDNFSLEAPSFPDHIKVPPEAADLLSKMLEFNAAKRIDIQGILAHKFMKKGSTRMPIMTPRSPTLGSPRALSCHGSRSTSPIHDLAPASL